MGPLIDIDYAALGPLDAAGYWGRYAHNVTDTRCMLIFCRGNCPPWLWMLTRPERKWSVRREPSAVASLRRYSARGWWMEVTDVWRGWGKVQKNNYLKTLESFWIAVVMLHFGSIASFSWVFFGSSALCLFFTGSVVSLLDQCALIWSHFSFEDSILWEFTLFKKKKKTPHIHTYKPLCLCTVSELLRHGDGSPFTSLVCSTLQNIQCLCVLQHTHQQIVPVFDWQPYQVSDSDPGQVFSPSVHVEDPTRHTWTNCSPEAICGPWNLKKL